MHKWDSRGETARRKCNKLLDALVTILKYKKITIDRSIYIMLLYYGTVSYLDVSTDDILKTNNNETIFPELRSFSLLGRRSGRKSSQVRKSYSQL